MAEDDDCDDDDDLGKTTMTKEKQNNCNIRTYTMAISPPQKQKLGQRSKQWHRNKPYVMSSAFMSLYVYRDIRIRE